MARRVVRSHVEGKAFALNPFIDKSSQLKLFRRFQRQCFDGANESGWNPSNAVLASWLVAEGRELSSSYRRQLWHKFINVDASVSDRGNQVSVEMLE